MRKYATFIASGLLALSACGSGETASQSSQEATTTSVGVEPSTTTTVPVPGGKLDIRIDPSIESLPTTGLALDAVLRTELLHLVRQGTVAIFYGSQESSIAWAEQTARDTNCFQDLGVDGFRNSVGWGRPCGFLMRVDAINFECSDSGPCKQGRTVAAHEFFHTVVYQLLEDCVCEPKIYGNKIPNWMNEGIADYVGYAMVYGSTPGTLVQTDLDRLRDYLRERAANQNVAVGVIEMEGLWANGFQQPWFQYLYDRSFLAVTLLVEKYGQEAVLSEFFANVSETDDFNLGFEMTFGISEAEFDAEFQEWIDTV